VDAVPDPLLLRKSGSTGNRTRTSESVARNSDHYTTEAVTTVPILYLSLWTRIYSGTILTYAITESSQHKSLIFIFKLATIYRK
jgi:hypothetical protein